MTTTITVLMCISMFAFGFAIGALSVHASRLIDNHAGAVWDKITGYVR